LLAQLLVAVFFTGLWPLSVFASEDLPDYPTQDWRYEYRDDDAGRAGTGTVNKGTRSVTFRREEIAFENLESSAKISRYFSRSNSAKQALFGAAENFYGTNWLMNYNRLLRLNANENRYEYLDENGQVLYFEPSNAHEKDGKAIIRAGMNTETFERRKSFIYK
jgi:hypothetical protein